LADILDILWPFGTYCVHLVHFPPVLVSCTKKNLAIPVSTFSPTGFSSLFIYLFIQFFCSSRPCLFLLFSFFSFHLFDLGISKLQNRPDFSQDTVKIIHVSTF
jgi:hypothetical protein